MNIHIPVRLPVSVIKCGRMYEGSYVTFKSVNLPASDLRQIPGTKMGTVANSEIGGAFNMFPDFFCTGILNCRRLLRIQYVIAIHLMRWQTNSYDFTFKWTATAGIEIHPDCHSWWISKMQSGREDTLEERYAIKFCFKLGKNATETYGMLQTAFWPSCMNRAWVFEWHKRFKESRESVREDERCGGNKEVNTPELIGQRLRVRVTMLRF